MIFPLVTLDSLSPANSFRRIIGSLNASPKKSPNLKKPKSKPGSSSSPLLRKALKPVSKPKYDEQYFLDRGMIFVGMDQEDENCGFYFTEH